ncbi:MAG: FtsQ-type POTRA domain-containing protein [Actinomycetota bacterium]
MNTMDRKIAERRHEITEERARGRLRWLLWLVLVTGLIGATVWTFTSPLLAIQTVTVTGAERTNPEATARRLGIVPGIATISTRGGPVEAALLADPWIAVADVVVSWPGTVEIHVIERAPLVVVHTADGEFATAQDGVFVEVVDGGSIPPRIEAEQVGARRPGERVTDATTLAAIEFVAALPPSLRRTATVNVNGDRLAADVAGFDVVLGRPLEMALKAAAVEALIASDIEEGSRIDVTAPTRPAVGPPQSQLDVENETSQDTQPSD